MFDGFLDLAYKAIAQLFNFNLGIRYVVSINYSRQALFWCLKQRNPCYLAYEFDLVGHTMAVFTLKSSEGASIKATPAKGHCEHHLSLPDGYVLWDLFTPTLQESLIMFLNFSLVFFWQNMLLVFGLQKWAFKQLMFDVFNLLV